MKNKTLLMFLVVVLAQFYVTAARAQAYTMTEVQPLAFGTFAIVNNSAPHTIIVSPDNSTTYDTAIVPDTEAQRGHYMFTGLPPNVTFQLGVSIPNPPLEGGLVLDQPTAVSSGGGPSFTLLNFTANTANELATDGDGDAVLFIGATLRTNGSGATYNDGIYSGTYDITLFY